MSKIAMIKITLSNGREVEMPTNRMGKILNMALSTMRKLEKEEGKLPPLEEAAKDAILTLQTRDTLLI